MVLFGVAVQCVSLGCLCLVFWYLSVWVVCGACGIWGCLVWGDLWWLFCDGFRDFVSWLFWFDVGFAIGYVLLIVVFGS